MVLIQSLLLFLSSAKGPGDKPWHGHKSYNNPKHFVTHVLEGVPGINYPMTRVLRATSWGGLGQPSSSDYKESSGSSVLQALLCTSTLLPFRWGKPYLYWWKNAAKLVQTDICLMASFPGQPGKPAPITLKQSGF